METTRTRKMPRLVVGDTHYELIAVDKAEASVKGVLEGISQGKITGTYTVVGVATAAADKKPASIKVASIAKTEAK